MQHCQKPRGCKIGKGVGGALSDNQSGSKISRKPQPYGPYGRASFLHAELAICQAKTSSCIGTVALLLLARFKLTSIVSLNLMPALAGNARVDERREMIESRAHESVLVKSRSKRANNKIAGFRSEGRKKEILK